MEKHVGILNKINGLDLFSGIGGISLALKEWVKPLTYCEIDPYCQAVLLSRMADESLFNSPVWDDIKTLDGNIFKGAIDIIYGGFPCQDISIAGHGKGLEGERSGLFFEIVRLAEEIKPKFIFLENVPAITSRGGCTVTREITALGYDCRWCVISAASVGALHRRERWFLLAHANGERCDTEQRRESFRFKKEIPKSSNSNLETDSYALRESSQQADQETQSKQTEWTTRRGFAGQHWPFESREHWQETLSSMGKSSYGISYHVDRLRALGNSVVPIQAKEAFKILMGIH